MGAILDVKNLQISFRTNNGTVKAVRDISFSLDKGETLAIVGESGSGKSVTARAIMGILAGNAIVEGGEIFFDGQDLMKIAEKDFHKIRGNKISMIFQDPLSSLNPIVKIGKQLTEAMLLNGKANQKNASRDFKTLIKHIKFYTCAAYDEQGLTAEREKFCKSLDFFCKFISISSKIERKYNLALAAAIAALSDIDGIKIDLISEPAEKILRRANIIASEALKADNKYLIGDSELLAARVSALTSSAAEYVKGGSKEDVVKNVEKLEKALTDAVNSEKINFFRLGCYLATKGSEDAIGGDTAHKNRVMLEHMNSTFMTDFIESLHVCIKYSDSDIASKRETARKALREGLQTFTVEKINTVDYKQEVKKMTEAVADGINPVDISKDSFSYTFKSALSYAIKCYCDGVRANAAAAKKGEEPKADIEFLLNNIRLIITRVLDSYELMAKIEKPVDEYAVEIIDYLKDRASASVYHITHGMAKAKSIKLMEEVGIPEPRKRYNQYPFQFSGGMRQRIVIAIALSANPDILICDEPTTALDVTIQAQILDLINNLKKSRKLTVIFITHDLGVVANMADKIAVMYAGKIVEYGDAEDVFYDPRHPYTWALLSSMPDLDTKEKLEAIPGTPPNMIFPPKGDAFAARNKYAMKIDFEEQPPMFEISPTHRAATWLLHPDAPAVEPPKIVTDRIKRMKNFGGADNEQ